MTNEEILAVCILVAVALFILPIFSVEADNTFWEEYRSSFLALLVFYGILTAVYWVVWAILWALVTLGALR